AELLASCPDLRIVVTSREPLHLLWEHLLPVPPLALPSSSRRTTLAHLERVASVALFLERARAIEPRFALTAENAPAVAESCVRPDGLPRAIELAAARIRVRPPATMLARLQHCLPLLRSSAPDRPSRHRTLRAAIDWSYDLLPRAERAVFRRLGVFVG